MILTFGDIETEKNKFYGYKSFVSLRDIGTEKVLVSNKICFGEKKLCSGYLNNHDKGKPLHIMFPKTIAYVKTYDGQTKWMYILIEDDNLLEKDNGI